MLEKPRSPKEPLFDKKIFRSIIVAGISIGLIVFAVWYYLINVVHMDTAIARGYIMALMVFMQNVHVFNCRSETSSAFSVPLRKNKLIVFGVLSCILLQVIVMKVDVFASFLQTSSIPFLHLIYLFLIALILLAIMEIYKKIMQKIKNKV